MPITQTNAGLFIVNSLHTDEGVMDKHSLWQRYVPLNTMRKTAIQTMVPEIILMIVKNNERLVSIVSSTDGCNTLIKPLCG